MIDPEYEIPIIDNYEYCFEGEDSCIFLSIAYNANWFEDTPFHLYVTLFGDFEKEEWLTEVQLKRALRELDERFHLELDEDDVIQIIDEFISKLEK